MHVARSLAFWIMYVAQPESIEVSIGVDRAGSTLHGDRCTLAQPVHTQIVALNHRKVLADPLWVGILTLTVQITQLVIWKMGRP